MTKFCLTKISWGVILSITKNIDIIFLAGAEGAKLHEGENKGGNYVNKDKDKQGKCVKQIKIQKDNKK